MDGHIDAGEIEDEDDEEYNPPSKKIKKEKNSDEENTSPQKKDQKLPKPTRFSMMLDDSSIVVNAPDPKPKIKKEPMVSILKFIPVRWPCHLSTVRKNWSSDREKLLKFEILQKFEVTRTIYSNSER